MTMPPVPLSIAPATSDADLAAVGGLVDAYAASLGHDLCFQGFDAERADLRAAYAAPGALLLARDADDVPVGCVAVRDRGAGTAEMKRLYVAPAARGTGLGRRLAEAAVRHAANAGFRRLVLDTLATMTPAISLYRSMGFRDTAPYYDNPLAGAVYLALEFGGSGERGAASGESDNEVHAPSQQGRVPR